MPDTALSVASRVMTAVFATGVALAVSAAQAADFNSTQTITKVAFGSCNIPEVAQPIWSAVESAAPDLWIWAGDAIYADTTDIKRHRRLYRMQNEYWRYRAIKKKTIVLGTWDDHDFGVNDGGKEYPIKKLSQKAFLDFLGEPARSLRRSRRGVYASYLYGRAGRRLKIILLDVRYHRETPGPHADILGNEQWGWLESEMRKPDSDLVLLVSGTTVLSNEHYANKWSDYPGAKKRLAKAIGTSPAPVVILSGDLHFAEMSKAAPPSLKWPLVEVTSSGMTHSTMGANYKSSIRVGRIYFGLNFGLIEIDWGVRAHTVTFQIRDTDGFTRISHVTRYQQKAR